LTIGADVLIVVVLGTRASTDELKAIFVAGSRR
jgi:hypothetical protein